MSCQLSMARITYLSRGKSLLILGTVVTCFAILWPKVFNPMLQSSLTVNQAVNMKSSMHPRMKAGEDIQKQAKHSVPQSFGGGPNPSLTKETVKNGYGNGSMGLIMPLYTIGILLVFLYSVFRYLRRDDDYEENERSSRTFEAHKQRFNGFNLDSHFNEMLVNGVYHEKGDCLKRLAINYVKCKRKLQSNQRNSKSKYSQENGDVSAAIQVLLKDMIQLRNYLIELEVSRNGSKPELRDETVRPELSLKDDLIAEEEPSNSITKDDERTVLEPIQEQSLEEISDELKASKDQLESQEEQESTDYDDENDLDDDEFDESENDDGDDGKDESKEPIDSDAGHKSDFAGQCIMNDIEE